MWRDLTDVSEEFYDHLLNSTLVTWDVENSRIDCHMCFTNSNFDESDLTNWENFRRHLSKFHSIRYIEKFMAMFDSVKGSFSVQNLDFRNKFSNPSNKSLPSVQQRQPSPVDVLSKETGSKRKAADNNYYNESDSDDENASLSKKRQKRKPSTKKLSAKRPVIEVEVKLVVEGEDDEDTAENSTEMFAENSTEMLAENESEEDSTPVGEVAKEVFHCELCSTTTISKQSMRRHCLQSHDLVTHLNLYCALVLQN